MAEGTLRDRPRPVLAGEIRGHRRPDLHVAAMVALVLAALFALGAVLLSPSQWLRQPRSAVRMAVRPEATAPPATTSSRPFVRNPEPRKITLTTRDLPTGYHVLREGPASFSTGVSGQPPPSWDVVFEPDGGLRADYQLAESLAVVYPTPALAATALDSQDALERGAGASEQRPASGPGDRVTVSVVPIPDRPQYRLVRVTWQSLNVIGQVSLLGQAGTAQPDRAVLLAMAQQDRIGAPAPVKEEPQT